MNKKTMIIQNIILFLISVLLYLTSFFVVLNLNNKEGEDTLKSYSSQVASELISEQNADDVIIKFALIDNLRVSIYKDGIDMPIADTRAFPSSEPGFDTINENVDKIYRSYSLTLHTDMVYHVRFDKDSNLYIRVGFPQTEVQKASRYIVYIGLVVFATSYIIYASYSFYNFRKAVAPLKLQVRRMQSIVGKDVLKDNSNDDLKQLSEAVDEVGREFKKRLTETNEAKQKVDFILNSMPSGIIVVDASNKIIMLNDAGCDILHLKRDEVINKNYTKLSLEKEKKQGIKDILKGTNYTKQDLVSNGKIYSFEISSIDYPWTKGTNKNGAFILIYDITSQRNADQTQREFFANASHELKSPLTSILGYQELIKEGIISSDSDLEDANERTLKEAQRMKEIIRYMLENSRKPEALSVSEHSVEKYCKEILESLELEIREKKIVVSTHYEPLVIKINHDDLDKLLRNIIVNAIKYNKKGGKISISINKEKKSIVVADSGIGINETDKDRIFERFYMVDKGRSRDNDSSGLGLSIVKHICDYYNFKIFVSSEINKGSTFEIVF